MSPLEASTTVSIVSFVGAIERSREDEVDDLKCRSMSTVSAFFISVGAIGLNLRSIELIRDNKPQLLGHTLSE
jgi:hypothetical protein